MKPVRLDFTYASGLVIEYLTPAWAARWITIIGSYFLHNGLSKTKDIIYDLWKDKILDVNNTKADSKTLLQEWSQSKKLGLPKYTLLKKLGPDHDPIFTVKVDILNNRVRTGKGNTIQDAEQDAAQKFLDYISKNNEKKAHSNN